MDENKVLKTENFRMLTEFAMGLIDCCKKRDYCGGCPFLNKNYICRIGYPEYWIFSEESND